MSATAFDRVLRALDQAGRGYKPDKPNHVQASCPGPIHKHGNRRMSLSITSIEGQVLMHCHVGDPIEAVLDALALIPADLFDDRRGATYAYDDGRKVHRSPDKKFTQSGNTDGQHTRLYRLRMIEQTPKGSRPIYLPEGEKDVHAVESLGEVATTSPMGAGNVHKCDWSPIYGHHAIVIVDKDGSGETRARYLRSVLSANCEIEFKQAKIGKDVSDHIAAGLGLDQLEPYVFPVSRLLIDARTGDWLDQQTFAPLTWVVPDVIPEGYSLLVGAPKIGKSWLSLSIAIAVASGGFMFGKLYCGARRPVLLLALEDSDRRLQSRIRKLQPDEPIPRLLTYITHASPNDVIPIIQEWLIGIPRHERPVIILDTIGKVIPPAFPGESSYGRDYRFSGDLHKITQQRPGMALIGLHHDRKAITDDFVESISGTNGLAGAADTILVINRPRNEPEGVLSITGRDVEEEQYGVKLTGQGQWTLMGDSLKEAAKSARIVKVTVGVGDRMADVIGFVNDHPEGVRRDGVADALGMTPKDATKYLTRAYESGRIHRPKRGLYTPVVNGVSGVSEDPKTPQTPHTTGGIGRAREEIDDQAWPADMREPDSWEPPLDDFDDRDESIDHETAEATLAAAFGPEAIDPEDGKPYDDPVPDWILNPELIEIEWRLSYSEQIDGQEIEVSVAAQPDRIKMLCLAGAEGHEMCDGETWYADLEDFGACLCHCHQPTEGAAQ